MTNPKIKLVRPAKTQISLRIRAVWSESSLIACAFYSLQSIQWGIYENPCRTGWLYRLLWALAGHTVLSFYVQNLIASNFSCDHSKHKPYERRSHCICEQQRFRQAWSSIVRIFSVHSHKKLVKGKHHQKLDIWPCYGYNKTRVTSKVSDQPVHPPSMARVLVYSSLDSLKAVEGTCDQRRLRSDCANAQADLSLRWSHKSYCRAHIIKWSL